jgi:sulfane dehydrogenase subunit SoxC
MEIESDKKVAGNGLLDRRLFLKSSLSFGSIALATTAETTSASPMSNSHRPDWMKVPGKEFSTYGKPSSFEEEVARFPSPNRLMRNSGVSWTPIHLLEGTITPNGLHFERHHNGVPQIDPDQHELLIHGLVNQPLKFNMDNLHRYPLRSKICFIECGGNSNAGFNLQPSRAEAGYFHGMISCAEWTGIPLSVLLDETGIDKTAKWIIAEGADAFAMNISIPIEKAMDDAIIALYQNGERIRPENGYPLRLVLPGWEGVTNVKWLRRLKVTREPIMARNETSKYTELLPSGKARQFTFEMEAKSLITSPSSGMVLKDGPGLYQITGLAWTGSGKIKQVDVSTDGGHTWAKAELQEPVLSKSLTRFRIPWHWQGNPSILKSRAIDETGYIQPEREQLIANRGRHGFFHYNAIVNWEVESDGNVSHIYNRNEEKNNNLGLDADWD